VSKAELVLCRDWFTATLLRLLCSSAGRELQLSAGAHHAPRRRVGQQYWSTIGQRSAFPL
jgi:hypothetical protein